MELIERAKQIATTAAALRGKDAYMSRAHVSNLNITLNGPVIVKGDRVMVPINVLHFSSFKDYDKTVVFDLQLNVISIVTH